MRAVHLRRAGDHVLDVVGVTRAVDVRVVPVRRAVLDVARRDRQDLGRVAASLRLGGLGHLVVRDELRPALVGRHLGERRRQRRLAVVDVADGADVDVRFGTIELLFRHVVIVLACVATSVARLPAAPSTSSCATASRSLPTVARGSDTRRLRRGCGVDLSLAPRANVLEPMTGIEPVTSSLPRTRSAN